MLDIIADNRDWRQNGPAILLKSVAPWRGAKDIRNAYFVYLSYDTARRTQGGEAYSDWSVTGPECNCITSYFEYPQRGTIRRTNGLFVMTYPITEKRDSEGRTSVSYPSHYGELVLIRVRLTQTRGKLVAEITRLP